jgi:hypothetical protein
MLWQHNMRKQIISTPQNAASAEDWLDVGRAASVEVTSEENGYPIESALLAEATQG